MYEWMDEAKCRGEDPELFFPKSIGATDMAKTAIEVCSTCPVIAECYAYRKQVDSHNGVWHGHWYRPTDRDHGGLRDDALILHDAGLTAAEIAEELDVPRQRVMAWVTKELKQREVTEVEIATLDVLLGDPVPAQRAPQSGFRKVWELLKGAPHD